MHSPPLYQIRKYTLREIVDCQYNLNITYQEDKIHRINQQDNMLFRTIRLVTEDYDKYNPYVVFVDCKGFTKSEKILKEILLHGFYIRGKHFVASEKSASMSRNATLGFVDAMIKDKIEQYINMDINMDKTVISKYLAYRGLMFSSCFCIENWYPYIVIVPDYNKTIYNQHIKFATDKFIEYVDKKTGENKIWTEKTITDGYKDIEITPFDGCGIHSPEITKLVKESVNTNDNPTSIMWRMPFVKGVTHEINFKEYYKEHGIDKIKDVWNVEHDIDKIEIIMTASMYKGLKYFKKHGDYRDWEFYWEKFKKYNHCVGISKWNYSFEDEPLYKRANYQILQDLKLKADEFIKLADYSKEWVEKIVNGDEIYAYCFLGLLADNHKASNEYMKALLKNPKMLHDKTIRDYLFGLLKKYIDEFKSGRLWIKGTHRILAPDLIMLLEFIGGMNPVGILKSGEFYSKNREGICEGEWLIERNPHICSSEHTILNGAKADILDKYCGHLSNIIMTNGYDLIDARLNGSDKDGDLVIVTDTKIMKDGVDRSLLVVMDVEDKITALEESFIVPNIIKSVILSMDNRIGEYSNVATGYHNKMPNSAEQKQKYLNFIDLVSILNAKEIDYAKCGVRFNLPKYIAKYAKPLPYFMKFAGTYYATKNKFLKSKSIMNNLCWDIEKWSKTIRFKRTFKDFDYHIMIDSSIAWNEYTFKEIEDIFLMYSKEMNDLQKQNNMRKTNENYNNFFGDLKTEEVKNTKVNWGYYYEQYIEKVKDVCPNIQELANYAVEICYGKYPKRSKKFAWIVAGEGIVKNIPQESVKLPQENEHGKYEYLGKKYDLIDMKIEGELFD